jgi:hypothetical protein
LRHHSLSPSLSLSLSLSLPLSQINTHKRPTVGVDGGVSQTAWSSGDAVFLFLLSCRSVFFFLNCRSAFFLMTVEAADAEKQVFSPPKKKTIENTFNTSKSSRCREDKYSPPQKKKKADQEHIL